VLLDTIALKSAAHHAKTSLSAFLLPLPADALKGFFIRPDAEKGKEDDPIPWDSIFRAIRMLPHDAVIIPDIRYPDETEKILARCREGCSPIQADEDAD
jgi:hypothetical protein